MNYIEKLTDEMVAELMRCYAENYEDIEITKRTDEWIDVELIVNGIPENYSIEAFNVTVYDWCDDGEELIAFRKKMLEFFGNQYAIDYLLNV